MVSLTMSPNKKNFVLDITRTFEIKAKDLVRESLPLGFPAFWVELYVGWVSLVDQAEIGGYLSPCPYR